MYGLQKNRTPAPYTAPPTEPSKPATNSFWGSQNKKVEPVEPSKPTTNSFWGSQAQKVEPEEPPQPPKFQLKKENSFHNRYSAPEHAPVVTEPTRTRYGATPGIVNKAKEGLAGSAYSRPEQKSPIVSNLPPILFLNWYFLLYFLTRKFSFCL